LDVIDAYQPCNATSPNKKPCTRTKLWHENDDFHSCRGRNWKGRFNFQDEYTSDELFENFFKDVKKISKVANDEHAFVEAASKPFDIHKEIKLHDSKLCVNCLIHPPSVLLQCDHILCQKCFNALTDSTKQYAIDCPFCAKHTLPLTLHPFGPKNAGVRILIIHDAPPDKLKNALEKICQDKLPYKCFDLIVGIKLGGVFAICLGIYGWSVAESYNWTVKYNENSKKNNAIYRIVNSDPFHNYCCSEDNANNSLIDVPTKIKVIIPLCEKRDIVKFGVYSTSNKGEKETAIYATVADLLLALKSERYGIKGKKFSSSVTVDLIKIACEVCSDIWNNPSIDVIISVKTIDNDRNDNDGKDNNRKVSTFDVNVNDISKSSVQSYLTQARETLNSLEYYVANWVCNQDNGATVCSFTVKTRLNYNIETKRHFSVAITRKGKKLCEPDSFVVTKNQKSADERSLELQVKIQLLKNFSVIINTRPNKSSTDYDSSTDYPISAMPLYYDGKTFQINFRQ